MQKANGPSDHSVAMVFARAFAQAVGDFAKQDNAEKGVDAAAEILSLLLLSAQVCGTVYSINPDDASAVPCLQADVVPFQSERLHLSLSSLEVLISLVPGVVHQ